MDQDSVEFRADEATEHRLRESVLPGLAALLDELPVVPPKGVDPQVYAHAFGFYCRIARSCQAALLLLDASLGSEAAPVRRAAWEHVLALAWVIDEGEPAIAALIRAHQARTRSVRDLLGDRWTVKAADFDSLLGEHVDSQGQDHLVGFGNLAKTYSLSNDLLVPWLTDTAESHPSYLTARAYWHDEGQRLAMTAKREPANEVHAIAFAWWLAACQIDRLVGWGERLASVGTSAGLPVMLLDRIPEGPTAVPVAAGGRAGEPAPRAADRAVPSRAVPVAILGTIATVRWGTHATWALDSRPDRPARRRGLLRLQPPMRRVPPCNPTRDRYRKRVFRGSPTVPGARLCRSDKSGGLVWLHGSLDCGCADCAACTASTWTWTR